MIKIAELDCIINEYDRDKGKARKLFGDTKPIQEFKKLIKEVTKAKKQDIEGSTIKKIVNKYKKEFSTGLTGKILLKIEELYYKSNAMHCLGLVKHPHPASRIGFFNNMPDELLLEIKTEYLNAVENKKLKRVSKDLRGPVNPGSGIGFFKNMPKRFSLAVTKYLDAEDVLELKQVSKDFHGRVRLNRRNKFRSIGCLPLTFCLDLHKEIIAADTEEWEQFWQTRYHIRTPGGFYITSDEEPPRGIYVTFALCTASCSITTGVAGVVGAIGGYVIGAGQDFFHSVRNKDPENATIVLSEQQSPPKQQKMR